MHTDYIQQNKIATQWLLQYAERKQAYLDRLAEFNALSAVQYRHTPGGTDISQPSENKALSLVRLDEDREWLKTIEDAESTLSRKKKAFLDFRRLANKIDYGNPGKPAWIAFVMERFADWHNRTYGMDFVPSERAMQAWWNRIVDVTVRIAIKRGCL